MRWQASERRRRSAIAGLRHWRSLWTGTLTLSRACSVCTTSMSSHRAAEPNAEANKPAAKRAAALRRSPRQRHDSQRQRPSRVMPRAHAPGAPLKSTALLPRGAAFCCSGPSRDVRGVTVESKHPAVYCAGVRWRQVCNRRSETFGKCCTTTGVAVQRHT